MTVRAKTAADESGGAAPMPLMVKNRHGKIRIHNPKYTRPFNVFLLLFTVLSLGLAYIIPYDFGRLLVRIVNIGDAIRPLLTIDFSEIDLILPFFYQTLSVAVLSTIYSALIGLFFAVFMARNITPNKFLPPILAAIFTFIRAIPSFVFVLLVLVSLGFGSAPAIIGVTISSTAFFARAFAHAFEEVDSGTLEALEATGANRIKIFFSAILPSALTMVIAWLTVNFETNFHGATILGVVGAGGIGHIIAMAFGSNRFGRAWVAVFAVVLFTYAFEISTNILKRKLKGLG
ncbi:MAG: ABC transporter permease subunit [Oscillospiraceae bacterium]|nr:ABC transporter permease subunit [Oscillospiraceae bacterium]